MLCQFYQIYFSFLSLAVVPFFNGYETVFLEGKFIGFFSLLWLIVVMYVFVAQRAFN